MRNTFDRLRHDAVIGRHNQYNDIGYGCTASPHLTEGGVTWSVNKCQLMTIVLDLISSDVLGNSTMFRCGDICGSQLVNECRFAVINVSENRDNRRTSLQVFRSIFAFRNFCDLFLNCLFVTNLQVYTQFKTYFDRDFFFEGGVNSHHVSSLPEDLHNRLGRTTNPFGEGSNGKRKFQFGS